MSFEIDFLPVEAGERSGDAIALKITRGQTFWVIVIDGGYSDSGDALVEHINRYYNTNIVDLAILTHPDGDHATGMLRVLRRMTVRNLWMHQPWNHGNLGRLFTNRRVSSARVQLNLRRDLDAAAECEEAALAQGTIITEPFYDTRFNDFVYVLGPTLPFYQAQIAHFDCTPEPATPAPGARLASLAAIMAAQPRHENWANETLEHECSTSAENDSSVITAVKLAPDYWAMFTGDAGETALTAALNGIVSGFSLSNFKFVQIPHHGSEHNISPTLLNRWLGAPQLVDRYVRTAFVSSAAAAPKHPSDKVMNAFRRRGAWPYATEGTSIRHASPDAPARYGWTNLDPYPFYQGAA